MDPGSPLRFVRDDSRFWMLQRGEAQPSDIVSGGFTSGGSGEV